MRGIIFALVVFLAVVGQISVEAYKMNKFKQLLLNQLENVNEWAQNYLDSNNLPFKTTPDYP